MAEKEETNSVCSEDDTKEELEIQDKKEDEEEDSDSSEESDEEEESEDEEEDEDETFDPTIIQYELFKNFLVDDEGVNVATHLGTIAKELRTLNKIMLKKVK